MAHIILLCIHAIGRTRCDFIVMCLVWKLSRNLDHQTRKILLLDMGDGSHMELFQPTVDGPKPGDPAPNNPVNHFALTTTDIRGAVEHVRAAGYEITVEPRDVDLGGLQITIAFFLGPNGESVEFFQTN